MHWNHRVIRRTDKTTGQISYEVFEVYYDEDDRIDGWTSSSVAPFGETIEELCRDVQHFAKALQTPVLVEIEVDGQPELVEEGRRSPESSQS